MNSLYNDSLNGVLIYRTQIGFNITSMERNKWDYIVIHDTANTSHDADDYMHYKYFNGGNKNSSADFFVDHDSITKLNDYTKYYTWHCGEAKIPKIPCYNQNSIGVEICVNFLEPAILKRTIDNTIILVKEIIKYNSNIKVVRHFDVTGKLCPGRIPMVDKTPYINKNWTNFLASLYN